VTLLLLLLPLLLLLLLLYRGASKADRATEDAKPMAQQQ
jgi:hypothetical protein